MYKPKNVGNPYPNFFRVVGEENIKNLLKEKYPKISKIVSDLVEQGNFESATTQLNDLLYYTTLIYAYNNQDIVPVLNKLLLNIAKVESTFSYTSTPNTK